MARRCDLRKHHRGLHRRRLPFGPREQAFADEWEKENNPPRFVNHGLGILENLMYVVDPDWDGRPRLHFWFGGGIPGRFAFWPLRRRDAVIAATVVQWLGTNCGMAFLERVLRRCGYRLERIREERAA